MTTKIPIILDTDIGGDIDDAWALALLLKSPEFDLKLVLTDTGDVRYRAAVAAKYLEAAGRSEIPIGLGVQGESWRGAQDAWLGDYQLEDYPGAVLADGVGALIDLVMGAEDPVTLICIGPVPNIAAALEREPRIADRVKLVGMFGSLRQGYNGRSEISAETNVRVAPQACRQMLHAFPHIALTPLDTCGHVKLVGKQYQQVVNCPDPLIQALIESTVSWAGDVSWTEVDAGKESSTLFDTVAVYMALEERFLEFEHLGVRVTDDGFTLLDDSQKRLRWATGWRDLPAFEAWLTARLTAGESTLE